MPTAIEISTSAIRVCRYEQGRISALESFPIPADADPVAALEAAPLPRPLGEVRVALSHTDLLLRVMVQPPVPQDRLDRLVRFEVQGLTQDGDKLMNAWRLAAFGGGGSMRILCLVAKESLVERLRQALVPHGGRLSGLTLPGVASYHAWRHVLPADTSTCAIIDVGGSSLQMTFVRDGELAFTRSQSPAIDQLVDDMAGLRGIATADAREMMTKLGTNPPQDIKDLISRQGGAIGSAITNAIRFAKAQLQLEDLDLHAIYLTGAGARVAGLAEAVAERVKVPVRILNPFAGHAYGAENEVLDRHARLPSPWTACLGLAAATSLDLDVMDQARAERRAFWQTSGVLRVAAAAVATLLILGLAVQELRGRSQSAALDQLVGENGQGLVPMAEAEVGVARALESERDALAARLTSLGHSRDPGRTAIEFMNLLAALQDPEEHPVYIRRFGVQQPSAGAIQVEIEGFAEDARARSKAEVLNGFRARMEEGYRSAGIGITKVADLKVPVQAQRQPFHWVIEVATVR